MNKCFDCIFYSRRTFTCDYYLITGQRRGSTIEDCKRKEEFTEEVKLKSEEKRSAERKNKREYTHKFNEEEVKKLYDEGLNDREIGERVGVTGQTIRKWRKSAGIEKHPAQKQHNYKKVEELYIAGYTDAQISNEVGLCTRMIYLWRKAGGLLPNKEAK